MILCHRRSILVIKLTMWCGMHVSALFFFVCVVFSTSSLFLKGKKIDDKIHNKHKNMVANKRAKDCIVIVVKFIAALLSSYPNSKVYVVGMDIIPWHCVCVSELCALIFHFQFQLLLLLLSSLFFFLLRLLRCTRVRAILLCILDTFQCPFTAQR